MRKSKRIIAILLASVLSIGLLGGCSSGEDKVSDKNKAGAKGRYVEKDIKLPGEGEKPIGMSWKDNTLQMYVVKIGENDKGDYGSYVWEAGQWSDRKNEEWLNDGVRRLGIDAVQVCAGQDGKLYAHGFPSYDQEMTYGSYILKSSQDGKTAEDITPADLKKVGENGYASMLADMDVLSDGSLAITSMSDQTKIYRDGKEVFSAETPELTSSSQNVLAVSGDSLAVVGTDVKTIHVYDSTDFKEKGSILFDKELYEMHLAAGQNGEWYLLNTKGIQRFQETGSIVETLMEGSNGLMSMDSVTATAFQKGDQEDFYALYADENAAFALKHYVYDPEIATVPDQVLTVYGLKESPTVAQGVYEFQQKNPDVKVEYTTALAEEEEVTADAVKSLNTELVSGNGADVLILDGLPVDSYIEKGILADITNLGKELKETGVLTDVIGSAAQKDGKIYALPARIGVPVYYGTEEENQALESLDALHTYITNNPDKLLFGKVSHGSLGTALLNTMYSEIEKTDGSLDEEKLTTFLEDWMKLCEIAESRKFEEEWELKGFMGTQPGMNFSINQFVPNASGTHIVELTGLDSMMVPFAEMERDGHLPSSLKGLYAPYAIAGINASTEQQELAEAFIRTLFGEEVQGTKSSDGYSVTEYGLASAAAYVDTEAAAQMEIYLLTTDPETGEVIEMTASYPDGEKIRAFNDLVRGLRTPFLADRVMSQTIWDEMENLYNGSVDAAGAAKAMIQKINTYLAE